MMVKSRKSKHAKASKLFLYHHREPSLPREKSREQHSHDLHQDLPIAYKARPTELRSKNFRYSCRSCSRTFATVDGPRNHFQAAHPRVETTSTDPRKCVFQILLMTAWVASSLSKSKKVSEIMAVTCMTCISILLERAWSGLMTPSRRTKTR